MTDKLAPIQQVKAQPVDALSVDTPAAAELLKGSPPKIEVVARAVDIDGKNPRRVIEGRNHLNQPIRHLLPEEHLGNRKRVTNALIREGFNCGAPTETGAIVEHVMAASPPVIAMYADRDGWQRNHSAFALRDKVCTETDVFPRYTEGVVEPAAAMTGKLDEHLGALRAFDQPTEIAAVGAAFAGLVAPLIGYGPLVVALSGATPDEVGRASSIAHSIFDTECGDLAQVQQITGASQAMRFAASTWPEVLRKPPGRSTRAVSPNVASTSRRVLAVVDQLAAEHLSKTLAPSDLLVIPANSRSKPTTADNAIQDDPAAQQPSLKYHGSVGATFITELVKRRDNVIQNARDWIPRYRDGYAKQFGVAADDDDPTMQTLTHVALLYFAIRCAGQFEVCPWSKETVTAAMGEIAARCHDHQMKRQHAFEREVVNAVKALAHECVKAVKGRHLVLIEPVQFDEYVVAHRDRSHVLAALRRKGLLVTTKGNATQYQVRMPSKSDADARRWMYAIDGAALRRL